MQCILDDLQKLVDKDGVGCCAVCSVRRFWQEKCKGCSSKHQLTGVCLVVAFDFWYRAVRLMAEHMVRHCLNICFVLVAEQPTSDNIALYLIRSIRIQPGIIRGNDRSHRIIPAAPRLQTPRQPQLYSQSQTHLSSPQGQDVCSSSIFRYRKAFKRCVYISLMLEKSFQLTACSS